MGHRRAEKGHQAIAGELVDGAFVFEDDLGQRLHGLVDDQVQLFAIQAVAGRGEVGHIQNEDGDLAAFAGDLVGRGVDLLLKRVGHEAAQGGRRVDDGRRTRDRRRDGRAALTAELAAGRLRRAAGMACWPERGRTFLAETGPRGIFSSTTWTQHRTISLIDSLPRPPTIC